MGPLEATAPIEGTSREETVGRDSDRKSVGAGAFGPPAAPFSIYSLTRLAGSSRGNGADQNQHDAPRAEADLRRCLPPEPIVATDPDAQAPHLNERLPRDPLLNPCLTKSRVAQVLVGVGRPGGLEPLTPGATVRKGPPDAFTLVSMAAGTQRNSSEQREHRTATRLFRRPLRPTSLSLPSVWLGTVSSYGTAARKRAGVRGAVRTSRVPTAW